MLFQNRSLRWREISTPCLRAGNSREGENNANFVAYHWNRRRRGGGAAFVASAQAQDTPTDYFSISIAAARPDADISLLGLTGNVDFDTGAGVHWAAGRDHGNFRGEVEGSYSNADASNVAGSGDTVALMVNGWFDIDTGTAFTPFIGGGIGAARVSFENESDTGFAAQIGAGVAYQMNDSTAVEVGLRYLNVDSINFGGVSVNLDVSSILIGLRFSF
ncbi:MAG: porin family protein [Rhodobacteraceae bacterium]|nr:porin family protein [Paracoccaceae bacterium]